MKQEARRKKKETGARAGRQKRRTAQRIIPVRDITADGIAQMDKNWYSLTLQLDDINYHTAGSEEQESIFTRWSEVLNLYGGHTTLQITTWNQNINPEQFREKICLPEQSDSYNAYRAEWNQMLFPKNLQDRSNVQKRKFLTIGTEAPDENMARDELFRLAFETNVMLKKNGSAARQLSQAEEFELLYDVYRPDHIGEFDPNMIDTVKRRGATVRDYIASDSVEFKRDHILIGDQFAQILFIRDLPTFLTDQISDEFTNFLFPMILSVHLQPMDPDGAIDFIQKRITDMDADKMRRQKKGILKGIIEPFIPFQLRNSLEEANELRNDVVNNDQKLFFTSVVILHMAETWEQLKKQKSDILSVGRRKTCQVGVLNYQQEEGLSAALPLGINKLKIDRALTTESAAVFQPFSVQELLQIDGQYYGRNAKTGNLILFNRLRLKTPSGFVLGTPGSGKSFLTKREMIHIILATDDDVIIIDPEREYTRLTQGFNGQVIHISAASKNFINPMDLTKDYSMGENGEAEDPLYLKSDFIMSLFEVILGGRGGLSPKQQSIVDRCMREAYKPLMQHDWDPALMPTLKEFHALMREQEEEEAQDMAIALEMYVLGNLKVFSHRTNADIHNRIICYDTKDLGKNLKTMGMLIVLDAIWNRVTKNREAGRRTWLYVDEMSLFFQSDYLASYFDEVYRRFRKWGGIATGITQNVTPMLAHPTAKTMLSNSDFLIIMNQAASDRDRLAELLHISDSLLDYITNAEEGYGLLSIGKSIIPFKDKFPKNTQLYRMMTTKIDEVSENKTQTWKV